MAPNQVDTSLALIRRATLGFNEVDLSRVHTLGHAAWLQEQLQPSTIDDSLAERLVASLPSMRMTAQELFDNYPGVRKFEAAAELRKSVVLRAIHSQRQLLERTLEFWRDHFNVFQLDGPLVLLRTTYERDVLRPHALGSFRDLLRSTARSAAMLFYLDGSSSFVGQLNENYGRELLELHTLGVDAGYTEEDVVDAARCFTGWRFVGPESGTYGAFTFTSHEHDFGVKHVFGLDIPAGGGIEDGETLLDYLASHPATARHVSTKLARWFLGEDVPAASIERIERAFRATNGDLVAVIRATLSASELEQARVTDRPMLKRPLEMLAGLGRVVGYEGTGSIERLLGHLREMGETPFGWSQPDGFPNRGAHWSTAMTHRWSFVVSVLEGQGSAAPMVGDDVLVQLAGSAPPAALAAHLMQLATGGPGRLEDVQIVQRQIDMHSSVTPQIIREALLMIVTSPSYQYH
jgi:uncharacterized protein (DUF1800 family)